jgi:AbrB family looped-hinge helix DNA binding protein
MKFGKCGQVTIPSALRETLGRMPGTEVEFEMGDDPVFL